MKIGIFCSSSNDIDNVYIENSRTVLEYLFKNSNDLVFGAFNEGLMGTAYETAKKYNRLVIGIAPNVRKDDFKKIECDKEIITNSIKSRTELLIEYSDCLVFLPGGIGTIHELIAVIDMKRNYEIDKPIIIFNDKDFYTDFFNMLNKLYAENFANSNIKSIYTVCNNYMDLKKLL